MINLMQFEPAVWARDSHSQTILADLIPSPKMNSTSQKWTIELEDGDQLVCKIDHGISPFVVLLCHGLTGNAEAGYNHRVGKIFLQQGHTICRMNHRNCGDGLGLARRPYHAGRSEDIARIIYELKKRFPTKKIFCVGFSMSGNASLLLTSGVIPTYSILGKDHFESVAKQHKWAMPDLHISVNPPIELSQTTDRFLENFNRFYQWNFVREFHRMLKQLEKMKMLDRPYKTHPFMSIRNFDDTYTAQNSGFGTSENYYQSCAAYKFLDKTFVPTTILTSKDDPIVQYKFLANAKKSDQIRVIAIENGGHMGFLSKKKTPLGNIRWMDYAVNEIFQEMIR